MPTFIYRGEPERVYANIPGEVIPGETYDLEADPNDGRWEPQPPEPEPPTTEDQPEQEASATAGASSVSEAVASDAKEA